MHPVFEQFLDLLFPPRCAGCGCRGALFCPTCIDACQPVSPATDVAQQRLQARPFLASLAGAYVFDDRLRRAIHVLKYRRRARMAVPLGELLTRHVACSSVVVDAVLPVPLHPERERARGFNQAALLAQPVARHAGVPLLTHRLVRVRHTGQQVGLDRAQRRANMRDAFAWQAATSPPPRVLLIDDVLTTGATLAAAAQALCLAGATEVHALALARG